MKFQTMSRLFSAIVVKMQIDSHCSTTKKDKTIKLPKCIIIGLLLLSIGAGNVNAVTRTWNGNTSNNWNTASNWRGSTLPTIADDVIIPNNKTVIINTAAVCKSFTIASGIGSNTITISPGQSLTVSGAVTIEAGNSFWFLTSNKIIDVGTGILTASSIIMANNDSNNDDSYISISTGTVNVSGNITMNGSADRN